MDPLVFRIIFLVLAFAGGGGFIIYIFLAIIIPKEQIFDTGNHSKDSADHFRQNMNDFVADVRSSAQKWAGEARSMNDNSTRENRRMWFGIIIVVIGAVAFINTLFPQYWIRWNVIWPILIIVLGVAILSRGGHHR